MASQIEICNMAIVQVGGNRIDNIDDQAQVEAIACRDHYATALDAVLESSEWVFATARAAISPDLVPPSSAYTQSARFLLPADCVRVLEVNAHAHDWVREGSYIYASVDTLILRYIQRVVDTTRYPGTFVEALVVHLASRLAIPIAHSRELAGQLDDAFLKMVGFASNKDGMQTPTKPYMTFKTLNAR